jgi:two-component system response regulator AtoC
MPHALLVDDHPETLDALTELAEEQGFTVSTAETIDGARTELERRTPDVVVADLNLPDGSGLTLLDTLVGTAAPAVVVITGHASISTAIEALRHGVTDYLTKPLDVRRLREILADIRKTSRLPQEISELKQQQAHTGRFGGIVGQSPAIQRACELIARIAPSSASVLISGESGTGKDVVARTIHELSRRRHGPFVAVNCGAIPPPLMESELLGHERGSFTGADRRHKGVFERASRGTLFLDEITEMPIEFQVKLLRVLETESLSRVGGEELISVDVRILTSTNRNPQEAIEQGKLREDLYYRLKVFELHLPPLRERPGDIALLAQHFLETLGRVEGARKRLSDATLERLVAYSWPGNVRELRNVVHSAYILAGMCIEVDDLPGDVRAGRPSNRSKKGPARDPLQELVGMPIAEVERRLIAATLAHCDGSKVKAADLLGISVKTLYNRLNSYQQSAPGDAAQQEHDRPGAIEGD